MPYHSLRLERVAEQEHGNGQNLEYPRGCCLSLLGYMAFSRTARLLVIFVFSRKLLSCEDACVIGLAESWPHVHVLSLVRHVYVRSMPARMRGPGDFTLCLVTC